MCVNEMRKKEKWAFAYLYKIDMNDLESTYPQWCQVPVLDDFRLAEYNGE